MSCSSPYFQKKLEEKHVFLLGIIRKKKKGIRRNLAELGEDHVRGVGDRGDALGALLVEGDLELLL